MNKPYAEMLGSTPDEIVGRSMVEILGGDIYALAAPHVDAVLNGQRVEFVLDLPATDCRPARVVRVAYEPEHDGQGRVVGFVAAVLDIADLKRAEDERDENRKTLFALVECCPFGIYIVDDEFRIASVNAGSQDKAFVNVRPLIGCPFDEAMRIMWPEPVATDCINIFRHARHGRAVFLWDFVSPRADLDRTEGYEWELHRITLPGGRLGVVCYYFDATKLRQAERELKEADRMKDEFLATLAHELRNPLAPIRNGLQVMKLADGDVGMVEKSLSIMERQVGQMAHLIDDLMDLSRISRGKIVLQVRIRLSDAVQDAVDIARPLLDEREHDFVLDVPPEPIFVDADRTRLAQVFSN